MKTLTTISCSLAIVALAGAAIAGSHGGNPAVKARKAHMQLYAHNLGALGAMAKGSVDYDADTASAHAANLHSLAVMNQNSYWPQGSDNETLPDDTKALAAAWTNMEQTIGMGQDLATAASAMNDAAGNGLEALQAAMGALGGACGACHKANRAP